MKSLLYSLSVMLSLCLLSPLVSAQEPAAPKIGLELLYPHLTFSRPIAFLIPPDGTNRGFLVEQTGLIRILPEDDSTGQVFADFSKHMAVEKDFEEGLLGLAFHPRFKDNGKLYVYYTRQGPKRSVISEFQVSKDEPNQLDFVSERILMQIQQPEWNHNSGNLQFGPSDGFLYISVGDGGMRDGVHLLAQRLQAWNGKVLRIDVDSQSPGREYGIPGDNPFVGNPIASPEIYALGLRNPWGSWIDPKTGLFWLADVGQDLYEEINLIQKGGNYGWNFREGEHLFEGRDRLMVALKSKNAIPSDAKFIDPILEYPRTEGISITGGYVYRGTIASLKDHYLYGDWGTGRVWALAYDPASGKVTSNSLIKDPADASLPPVKPTGFYPDKTGEPILLDWQGKLYRITKG